MTIQRVLMVNKYLYPRGGAEVYMLQLAELLAEADVSSVFFAMSDPRNRPSATERFFPPNVDFENPRGTRRQAVAAGRMVYSPSARRGLHRLLDEVDVDVAHLHNIYHQLSPSVLAPLRRAAVPVVMTLHDYKLVCPVYTLLSHGEMCERCVGGHLHHVVIRRCNRGSLGGSALVGFESWVHRTLRMYSRGVDMFVCPSRYLARMLVAGGYPAERIRVIPNYVDPSDYHLSPPGTATRMLYAGRLSHEKGIDILLEAVAGTHIELRIAGDGPERSRLEHSAGALGVRAEFLGHVSKDRLRYELSAARAVVIPSVWPENCPLIALEAMAAGRPVVACQVGGLPELIRDGREGIVVQRGSAEELRAAMLRLADDSAKAELLGTAGRARVDNEFSPTVHRRRLLDLYASVQSRRRSVPA